jgi:hypothetical protein
VLTGEEMRCNLACGNHARQEWLALVNQEHSNPLVCDGKVVFALEQAANKEACLAALIAKWLLVLKCAAILPMLKGHMDKIFTAVGMTRKGKGQEDTCSQDGSLVLHVQGLKGLAMATNGHAYEPRYIGCFILPPVFESNNPHSW